MDHQPIKSSEAPPSSASGNEDDKAAAPELRTLPPRQVLGTNGILAEIVTEAIDLEGRIIRRETVCYRPDGKTVKETRLENYVYNAKETVRWYTSEYPDAIFNKITGVETIRDQTSDEVRTILSDITYAPHEGKIKIRLNQNGVISYEIFIDNAHVMEYEMLNSLQGHTDRNTGATRIERVENNVTMKLKQLWLCNPEGYKRHQEEWESRRQAKALPEQDHE